MSSKPQKKATNEGEKKKQRIRPTNKSLESQRFSSVKMPKGNEVTGVNAHIHEVDKLTSSGMAFDPIPNDGMFTVVENSKYWPPPSLEELQQSSGIATLAGDGMDMYDRREDDAAAKKEKIKILKVMGEVNHPRGKGAKNVKVKLDDDDE